MATKTTITLEDDLVGGPADETLRFGRQRGTARTASSRAHSGDIPQWAKDHGIKVSDCGRIPAKVTGQYEPAREHANPSQGPRDRAV